VRDRQLNALRLCLALAAGAAALLILWWLGVI